MLRYKMKAVFIGEDKGNVREIDLDIAPKKNEIFKLLGGPGTFVGQWPDTDVVVMKCKTDAGRPNENTLAEPFHGERVIGPILMIRMDQDAEHQDFTREESTLLRLVQR
jgi:hypothetical protein